jgi:hypothetical protein
MKIGDSHPQEQVGEGEKERKGEELFVFAPFLPFSYVL